MHILFLTDNFIPEVNAPAIRTYEHAKVWIEQGYKVTVITCFPNYPEGKIYDGYKNKLYKYENYGKNPKPYCGMQITDTPLPESEV